MPNKAQGWNLEVMTPAPDAAQGGIIYSNAVTTVSPTYAREALEGGAAGWLRSTLAKPDVAGKFKVMPWCMHFCQETTSMHAQRASELGFLRGLAQKFVEVALPGGAWHTPNSTHCRKNAQAEKIRIHPET